MSFVDLRHMHNSIVKVYCVHTDPNYSLPWQMKHQQSSTSSGFVISDKYILTNAHSVENHTQVKVRRRGLETKFLAEVICIGRECDLAILTVLEHEFWDSSICAVSFGDMPHLQQTVTVIGYPVGGDNLSVTQGVVSRIDMQEYAHGSTDLLAVQIDAAINPGNSGGPVFSNTGECLGVAFQSLKDGETENIGYIIPTSVVSHFLTDFNKNKAYTGFPTAGFEVQRLENPTMREYFKIRPRQTGVLVKRISPVAQAAKILKIGDIILTIDGVTVANDGTIPYRVDERIAASYLISNKFCGDSCELSVLRNGKEINLELLLERPAPLVPLEANDQSTPISAHKSIVLPSYFIFAGFVFVALTEQYLRAEYGDDFAFRAPVKLLERHLYGLRENNNQQVVVLSQVLAHNLNVGFEYLSNTQVLRCNGTAIQNLKHLVDLVTTNNNNNNSKNSTEKIHIRLDLDYEETVILPREEAVMATEDVLRQHGIARDRSQDLLLLAGNEDSGSRVTGKRKRGEEGEGESSKNNSKDDNNNSSNNNNSKDDKDNGGKGKGKDKNENENSAVVGGGGSKEVGVVITETEVDNESSSEDDSKNNDDNNSAENAPKRKRGRPPKTVKRGRPPKSKN